MQTLDAHVMQHISTHLRVNAPVTIIWEKLSRRNSQSASSVCMATVRNVELQLTCQEPIAQLEVLRFKFNTLLRAFCVWLHQISDPAIKVNQRFKTVFERVE